MSLTQEDYELISDYLRDNLTEKEKQSVQERIVSDEVFSQEVALHEGISISISDKGWIDWKHDHNSKEILELKRIKQSEEITNLESKIKEVAHSYFSEKQSTKTRAPFAKYIIGIAAAAIACIFVLNLLSSDSDPSSLYQNYANWDQHLISNIEQSATNDTSGESYFKNGAYTKAIEAFQELSGQSNTTTSYALMYLGASYVELGQYDRALQAFDQLEELNELDSNRAYWFKAMLYLKKGDKEAAVGQLKIIISHPEYYNYALAKELLEEL